MSKRTEKICKRLRTAISGTNWDGDRELHKIDMGKLDLLKAAVEEEAERQGVDLEALRKADWPRVGTGFITWNIWKSC
jgi:hypothetical protein